MITKEQIIKDINKVYEKKRKVFPCTSNRASSIGGACIRELVYERSEWDKKQLPSISTQMIYEEGNHQEEFVKKKLMEAGYLIHQSQRSMSDNLLKKYNISGHIDFFIAKEGENAILSEVKSMHPGIFDQVNIISDLEKYPWTEKYFSQVQIYMFAAEEERAFLILKNKSNGQIKIIEVLLDLDHVESLLQKANIINQHIENGTLPSRIEKRKYCEICDYQHICTPDIINNASAIIEDPEFIRMLEERENLKPSKSKFEKIDKEVKSILKKMQELYIIVGNFQITKKESGRIDIKKLRGNNESTDEECNLDGC